MKLWEFLNIIVGNILIMIIKQVWYNIEWYNAFVTTSQIVLDYNQEKEEIIGNASNTGTGLNQSKVRS